MLLLLHLLEKQWVSVGASLCISANTHFRLLFLRQVPNIIECKNLLVVLHFLRQLKKLHRHPVPFLLSKFAHASLFFAVDDIAKSKVKHLGRWWLWDQWDIFNPLLIHFWELKNFVQPVKSVFVIVRYLSSREMKQLCFVLLLLWVLGVVPYCFLV